MKDLPLPPGRCARTEGGHSAIPGTEADESSRDTAAGPSQMVAGLRRELGCRLRRPRSLAYPTRGHGLSRPRVGGVLDCQLKHLDSCGFGLWPAELKGEGRLIGYIGLAKPTWSRRSCPASRSDGAWTAGSEGWRLKQGRAGPGSVHAPRAFEAFREFAQK